MRSGPGSRGSRPPEHAARARPGPPRSQLPFRAVSDRCGTLVAGAPIPLEDQMDEGRLMEFLHRFVVDFGATGAAGNVLVGEQLGLYRAMREGPLLPAELAARTE